LPPECDHTFAGGQFPSTPTPAPSAGNTTQITTCSFAGEFSQITGVASGQEYIASSSDGGDWITVRTGTSSGPVLASGTTPLTFTTTSADNLFLHWSVDSGCGTENVCRITSIEATNTAPPVTYCGGPIAITDATVNSNTVNVSGFGVTGPVSVQINNINHTWSGDVELLLVGPGGQSVVLMSGVGGSADFIGNNITFVATGAPAYTGPASGTFTPQGSTLYSGGTPAGPYGNDLGIFTGSVADGNWTLYTYDTATGDTGSIGEWCIVPSAPPTFCGGGAPITDVTTTVTTTTVTGFGTSGPIQVELYGLNHTWSGDVEVLLVGPGGQSVVLFSGAGGSADFTNNDVVFVPTGAPAFSGPASGTFTPQGSTFFGGGAPAPAGPYGADLNVFTGTNVDGTWSLYFFDSANSDTGSLDSWCITPSYPPACGEPTVELAGACADEASFNFSVLIGSVSDYDWEVVPQGNAQGVGVIASGSGVSGATATGLTASTAYTLWVRTDCGLDGASAYVAFNFTSGLVNDCSQDAIVLSNPCAAAQPAVAGTTIGAQLDADYVPFNVNYGTSSTELGVWYLLPGDNQQYTITSCNAVSYDTRITVFTGTPGALTPLVANDDMPSCGFGLFRSEVTFNALTGTDYYIYIHGYQFLDFLSVTGNFELSFTCAPLCLPQPSNDDCASAISLSPLPTSCTPITVSTECASPASVLPGCVSIFPTYNDVWYSFVATDASQSFDLTLGTATNVSVAIYEACGGTDLVCGAGLPSGSYAIPFLTVGNTYLVQLMSEASGAGTFDFCIYDGCPFPTGWAISNPTTEGFDLSWVDNAGVSSFDIYVAEVPAAEPDGSTVPTFSGVAGSPFTLTGLNAGTQYQVWVRADCGGGSFSLWSGGLFATTLAPPPGCGEQFFDTGGEFGQYANNENYVVTLTPDNAGERVRLTFTQFLVESGWDYMRIFNGPDETSPEFLSGYPGGIVAPPGSYTGATAPTEITSTHPSGALTIRFASDSSVPLDGWVADVTCVVPCTGVPAPGATTTSESVVCPGVPFTLGTANALPFEGLSYVWQSGPSFAGPWTTLATGPASTYTVPSQSVNTWYRVRVNCSLSGQTGVAPAVQVSMAPICYPVPSSPLIDVDTDLGEVTVGTGTSITDCVTPGPGAGSVLGVYSSFLNQPSLTNLVRGGSAGFNIARQQCGPFGPYSSNAAIYIDFNQNGVFELSEEVYDAGDLTTTSYSGTFNIPVTATLGQTGMRVIGAESFTDITPDLEFFYGEVEDYVVTIVNPAVSNDFQALATNVATGAFPTCSTNFTANLALATDSPETAGAGNDAWYTFTAVTNAVRVQVTGATDNRVELYDGATLIASEDDVAANGNETLVFDGLTAGNQYFVAVIANGTASAATTCISHLPQSGCSAPSAGFPATITSPCQQFKSIFTSASSYTAYFDVNAAAPFDGVSVSTPGTTYHPISSFVGLPPLTGPVTYQVRVDATYNLTDAAGNPVSVVVPGTFNCTRNVVAHASIFLRNTDASPNVRPANAVIGANSWLCGALYYEWTLEQFDAIGGTSQGLPVTAQGAPVNRFLNLTGLGLVPNGIYKVNVTPVFPTGNGNTGPDRWLIIAGPAAMILDGNQAEAYERNAEEPVIESALYPNPSNGSFVNLNITGVEDHVMVRVLDGTGRVVWSNNLVVEGSLNTVIGFERPLASGLYTVEMTYDGKVITERLMVQK
jgi:subtilisin-like proprotein convertase family protein